METIAGFDRVVHRLVKVRLGPQLVSIALPDQPPVTFSVHTWPNRTALFVVSQDKNHVTGGTYTKQITPP